MAKPTSRDIIEALEKAGLNQGDHAAFVLATLTALRYFQLENAKDVRADGCHDMAKIFDRYAGTIEGFIMVYKAGAKDDL